MTLLDFRQVPNPTSKNTPHGQPWPQVHPGVVRGARAAAGL